MTALVVVLAVGVGVVLGVRLNRSDPLGGLFDGHRHASSTRTSFPLAGKVEPPPKGEIYWGAYRAGAPYDGSKVTALERQVGRRPAIVMWYQEWAGQPDFPLVAASFLYDRGIVPMISWEPWRPPAVFGRIVNDQPSFRLARIADGAFDAYLRRYARGIKDYGGPVLMRPMHEMDGFWYPWSGVENGNTAADYVRAWRHIHDIFQEVGATNATWVWSVNHLTVPDTPENQVENYWPGPSYVDWIGVSGFNWGSASPFAVWEGFDRVMTGRYQRLLKYHKPFMLTETGAPEIGGDKARWISNTFQDILDHFPRLGALVWYDNRDSRVRDWRIDSSPAALAAFREAVANPKVLGANAAQASALPGAHGGSGSG